MDFTNPDQLANFYMKQSTAAIVQNVGFSTAQSSSLNLLTSVLRHYFEKACRRSLEYAQHGEL